MKCIFFSSIFIFSIGLLNLNAQNSTIDHDEFVATGGTATSITGSITYSVGQVFYHTFSGSGGQIRQGIQQCYDCYDGVGTTGTENMKLNYSAFPNPTIDYLNLKIGNYSIENLSYQLFDMNEKLISTKKIDGSESSIYMGKLPSATYFVKIFDNEKKVKTFKVIKN